MDAEKTAQVWQEAGTGSPPLLWTVKYWPEAVADAAFLTDCQYWHVADLLKEMARESEPTKCPSLDFAPIEEFWELKEKGGVLGKINLRVYFVLNSKPKEIVVMGVHKKEDERQLRRSIVVRIQRRKRLYLSSLDHSKGGAQ